MNPSFFDRQFMQPPFNNMNRMSGNPPPPNLQPIYKPPIQFSFENFEASFSNLYAPNKEHSTINLFSIFTKQFPKGDINEPVWFYKDPQGETQGPFSSINMDCWNLDKYFPLHLPIAWNQTVQFVTIEYFKGNPFSLVVLAQRYGNNLNRYIPNFSTFMQNRENMNNLNTLINKNPNNNNFGGNISNPQHFNNNFPQMGLFNNMGNMRFNVNPTPENAKFLNYPTNVNPVATPANFKNDDPLMQLLGIVGKSNQINMNFNFNRITPPPNPNYNVEQLHAQQSNFNFPNQQPQPQNLGVNLMNSLINAPTPNALQNNIQQPQQPNPIQNITSININNNPVKETQNIQVINNAPQQNILPGSKISTDNLKMMLGLGNFNAINEQTPKETKKDNDSNKLKDKEMEKRNADFPSLSEVLGKR